MRGETEFDLGGDLKSEGSPSLGGILRASLGGLRKISSLNPPGKDEGLRKMVKRDKGDGKLPLKV